MSKEAVKESELVPLTDEQLVRLMAELFESIKRKEEDKKDDSALQQMRQDVKDYENKTYNKQISLMRARLKLARRQCKVRNLDVQVKDLDV